MIINLNKEEVRACADIALNRWMMKWGSIDRPNYAGDNKKDLEPEIASNVRTIVAEYAVAKHYKKPLTFPFYPNEEHYFRSKFFDVQPNIEVKSVRTRDEIPVQPKDIKNGGILVGARVLDRDYYSQVFIYGWMLMDEVPNNAYWSIEMDGKRQCWRVYDDRWNSTDPLPELEYAQ